jgi:signal recognition particle receptor subunit beta
VAYIDVQAKQIRCKVVYWGPWQSGKSANLEHIWNKVRSPGQQAITVPAPPGSSVAYYDCVPLLLGEIRGFRVAIELYTVPGHPRFSEARFTLLERVDGLVFIADSQRERLADNAAALDELRASLARRSVALEKLPRALQCNKRDLPNAAPVPEVVAALADMAPSVDGAKPKTFEAVATQGTGVFDTLKEVSRLILTELKKGGA